MYQKSFEPIKSEDVPAAFASTDLLHEAVGFKSKTSIADGMQKFT